MSRLKAAKKRAEKRVRQLDLDSAVRTVARHLGTPDCARHNYYATVHQPDGPPLYITATFSASVNGAAVRLEGQTVYHAVGYGRSLQAFRDGPWVAYLMDLAEECRAEATAAKMVREAERKAQELQQFIPLDTEPRR